jgi:DNA-directed RNA polymerase subunit beta
MKSRITRNFGRISDAVPIPDLTKVQLASYSGFIQKDVAPLKRKNEGFEALLREIFPIVSYDKSMELEYVCYELEQPRYTPRECRELRLTYGYPLKIHCRLKRKDHEDISEQAIYLGELPVMIGGGEFIINGAERVIVNQLHRSPGVDFVIDSKDGDRVLHGCRIIPERGSWIEISVSKKDVMVVRIDQSSKIPATVFLRATDEKFGKTGDLIRLFHEVKAVKANKLKPTMWAAGTIVDTETGVVLCEAGHQLGESVSLIQSSSIGSVEVVVDATDPLIMNTLSQDDCESHEEALLKLYVRLRPGNPAQLEKAKTLFEEKFFDTNRYRLGKVGRFRINRKFNQTVDENEMSLRPEDFLNTMRYVLRLRNNEGHIDDIDHLGNRRLRTIDELAATEIRKGLLKLRRTVQERMSMKGPDDIGRIADLVNSKSVSSSIDYFFGRGELSQVVDQTNALSQLTHERRLSALGPGGLNRKRAGFEVRDVHISHYGRVCPIETPEGTNIGLIVSLGIFSEVDAYGFLITPYRKVKNGKLLDEIEYLRADQEMEAIFAPPSMVDPDAGALHKGIVLARVRGDLSQVDSKEVGYVDVSPRQTVGISAALIPFLEHDDANRALMGSNMQRQAVPLLLTEPPLVGTGMEEAVAQNSSMVVRARNSGVVTAVDGRRIVLNDTDEYKLLKYVGLNERTCLNQKPIVKLGQKVRKNEIIADGGGTSEGILALGRNVLAAFVPFDGYNFEDAILISERLVKDDVFTSIHIDEFSVEIRETKLGREEFTRDIPNVSEKALRNLDEDGIVREGTRVSADDILVGKVSPKSKTELTPEEKLLHAIFGRAGEDVKNDSLEAPSGFEGVVIDRRRFTRRGAGSEDQRKAHKASISAYEAEMITKECGLFKRMMDEIHERFEIDVIDPSTRQKVGSSDDEDVIYEQIENFDISWIKPAKVRDDVQKLIDKYWPKLIEHQEEKKRKLERMKHGDELQSGVLEMVKIYIATKRTLSIGDKMAGRHGNKGVIAKIMPEEDMPFLEDGTPIDICLNPLGVPSRMNVGQILETHLGWAAKVLGFDAVTPVFDGADEDSIGKVTEEANAHVRQRIAELEGKRIVESIDDAKEFLSKTLEFQFVTCDKGKVVRTSLEKVEALLMLNFAYSNEHPMPRFNRRNVPSNEPLSAVEKALLAECLRVIREETSWHRDKKAAPADKSGIYFFRDIESRSVAKGYIGIADRADGIRGRMVSHYEGLKGENEDSLLDSIAKNKPAFTKDVNSVSQAPRADEIHTIIPAGLKTRLFDGRTGEPFEQKATVGQIYMMKLHHLVDDKIHARATGPYSLITQQPLGGKARTGGQRFGEMEVWALEAYGAAYTLQELLTVKSDDIEGRTKIYESMVKGDNTLEAGTPISFDVLCNEIRGLGLNIQLEKKRLGPGSL